jgi:hypothetical protein
MNGREIRNYAVRRMTIVIVAYATNTDNVTNDSIYLAANLAATK